MKSWKDTLTPEQVAFLSSLRHASMSIQNEVDDAYECAESKQNFVDNMTNYLENLSAEAVGTIEEIQKLFEKEERNLQEAKRSKKPIEVDNDLLRDRLKFALGKEPREVELKAFREYVKIDIQQWIADNAKAFVDGVRE